MLSCCANAERENTKQIANIPISFFIFFTILELDLYFPQRITLFAGNVSVAELASELRTRSNARNQYRAAAALFYS